MKSKVSFHTWYITFHSNLIRDTRTLKYKYTTGIKEFFRKIKVGEATQIILYIIQNVEEQI